MPRPKSVLRRWLKTVTWTGDVSRRGLASALRRRRSEMRRVYGSHARMVEQRLGPVVEWRVIA